MAFLDLNRRVRNGQFSNPALENCLDSVNDCNGGCRQSSEKIQNIEIKKVGSQSSINRIQGRIALIPVISQKSTNAGYSSSP